MKKKILAISLVVSLVAIAALGVTLAYFTADDDAVNTFTVGNIAIELQEPAWGTSGSIDADTVYPGEALAKDPKVVSTGTNPCIVRLKVEMPTIPGVTNPVTLENLDTANWYKDGDYYYYLKPIATPGTGYPTVPDSATTALFTQIRISTAVTNHTSETSYDVKVTAQALQAQGIFSKFKDMEDGISTTNPPVYSGGTTNEIAMVIARFNGTTF